MLVNLIYSFGPFCNNFFFLGLMVNSMVLKQRVFYPKFVFSHLSSKTHVFRSVRIIIDD